MINIDLDRSEKYILGCSFGPDSMCLFDLLKKNKIAFVVAHVNYHIISNANEDEKKLKDYCKSNNIEIYIKELSYDSKKDGNEENWAREKRYNYFNEVANNLGIENLLIAHQLDDSIETYILQKERNNYVSYYGLNSCYKKGNLYYIRPLLLYRKKELQKYCDDNKIPYSIDYSNFNTKYKRNKIRREIISQMNDEEIQKIVNTIKEANLGKELQKLRLSKYFKNDFIDFNSVSNLSDEDFQAVIYNFIENKSYFVTLSLRFLLDFKEKCLKSTQGPFKAKIKQKFLEYSYGKIYFYSKVIKYEEKISENNESNIFKINTKSPLFIKYKLVFPLFIKPVEKNESVLVDGHYKKISRCFIDWKVPLHLRSVWPGIYNEKGELLYVPRYQENHKENNESLLNFNSNNLFF